MGAGEECGVRMPMREGKELERAVEGSQQLDLHFADHCRVRIWERRIYLMAWTGRDSRRFGLGGAIMASLM